MSTSQTIIQSISFQLKLAAAVTIGFGAIILLGAHPTTDIVLRFVSSFIFLAPFDTAARIINDDGTLLSAILGGVMIGWGAMIWQVTQHVLPENPGLAKRLILPPLILWFITDSAASLVSAAPFNAVLNVAFFAMFLLPLFRIRTMPQEMPRGTVTG